MDNDELDIRVEQSAWNDLGFDVKAMAIRALNAAITKTESGTLSILLTDDDEMRSLNRDWRDKDKPTDVLSFPADPIFKPHLGDIAIGLSMSQTDAITQGKSFSDHFCHLIVHGYLHLLGYDHEYDEEAVDMENLEREILATLDIADPYSVTDASA